MIAVRRDSDGDVVPGEPRTAPLGTAGLPTAPMKGRVERVARRTSIVVLERDVGGNAGIPFDFSGTGIFLNPFLISEAL